MTNIHYMNPDRENFTPVSQANPLPVSIGLSTGLFNPASAAVVSYGEGYVPGDQVTVSNGSQSVQPSVLEIDSTQVVTIEIVDPGADGTPGPVTIEGTTGTGTPFEATGTINGDGELEGPLTITVVGAYTVNPTDITEEPVTGGSLVGATVAVTMGALAASIVTPGVTTAAVTGVSQTSTDGAGVGATFTLTGTEQPSLSALIGSPDDASGTPTVIGLLKEIAANTAS